MQRLSGFFLMLLLLAGGCSGDTAGRIEASGTIEGTDVDVGVEVAGRIREVRVQEGARVATGDTLVVIDDMEMRLQLAQARANAAALDAQYAMAREGPRREDITQAAALAHAAEADYNRARELLDTRTITRKQYDDAEARYVSARETHRKLADGLRVQEVEGARARRDQAVAAADLLRKKVADCIVRAPAPGIVTLRAFEPGELVGLGSTVIRLTALDTVRLMIYVPEADLGRIALGQEAGVSVDAHPGRVFPGRVTYLSPTAEFTPKNVQTKEERTKLVFGVRILIPNPGLLLKPGLPADALLEAPRGA
jgi:HlyD family secretion protein